MSSLLGNVFLIPVRGRDLGQEIAADYFRRGNLLRLPAIGCVSKWVLGGNGHLLTTLHVEYYVIAQPARD